MRKIEQFLFKNNIPQVMMDTHIFATIAFTYLILLPSLYSFIENELAALVVQYVCNSIIALSLYIVICKFVYKDYTEKLIKRKNIQKELLTLYLSEFVIKIFILFIFEFINSNILNKYGIDILNTTESSMDKIFESNPIIEILIAAILAPICEELIFRGIGLTILKKHGKTTAILFTALLFGLCHGSIVQSTTAIIAGIVLGYVCLEYGLIYSILIHMFNNFVIAIVTIEEYSILLYVIIFIGVFLFNEKIFAVFKQIFDRKSFNVKVFLAELFSPVTIGLILIAIISIIDEIVIT